MNEGLDAAWCGVPGKVFDLLRGDDPKQASSTLQAADGCHGFLDLKTCAQHKEEHVELAR